jgi:hypothetical protein
MLFRDARDPGNPSPGPASIYVCTFSGRISWPGIVWLISQVAGSISCPDSIFIIVQMDSWRRTDVAFNSRRQRKHALTPLAVYLTFSGKLSATRTTPTSA